MKKSMLNIFEINGSSSWSVQSLMPAVFSRHVTRLNFCLFYFKVKIGKSNYCCFNCLLITFFYLGLLFTFLLLFGAKVIVALIYVRHLIAHILSTKIFGLNNFWYFSVFFYYHYSLVFPYNF